MSMENSLASEVLAEVNRPRYVLLQTAVEDLRPHAEQLREQGWPAEILAVNEPDWFGVRLEIRLDALPQPTQFKPKVSVPGPKPNEGRPYRVEVGPLE